MYLRDEELVALHEVAARSGRSVADLAREPVRLVPLRPGSNGRLERPDLHKLSAIDALSFVLMALHSGPVATMGDVRRSPTSTILT